jgi:hypothetical protein
VSVHHRAATTQDGATVSCLCDCGCAWSLEINETKPHVDKHVWRVPPGVLVPCVAVVLALRRVERALNA